MARIIFRGLYAAFPTPALTDAGVLAYSTDLLVLFEWNGTAWTTYSDYPDYEGGKSKLYSGADWAAHEAYDQNFEAVAINCAYGVGVFVAYAVPATMTLYLTQLSSVCMASVAANADNNHFNQAYIFNNTTGLYLLRLGSNGGGAIALNKPLVIPGGDTVHIGIIAMANHNCDVVVNAGGYLI